MHKALVTLALVTFLAATAAAQTPQPTQPPQPGRAPAPPPTRVLMNEGSAVSGTIAGGSVTLRTTFGGDLKIDGRRIQSFAGTKLTLDDGSVVHGTFTAGALQLTSVFGTLAIPVDRVAEIQSTKSAAAAAVTPPAPPAPVATAPTPAPVGRAATVPPKPTTAALQIVNETRRNLSVCLNDERPCMQVGPSATTSRTLDVGPLKLKVESTHQIGFVVMPTGSFERSLAVDKDTTFRVTEGDFR